MKVMEEQWIEKLRERFADCEQPAPDGLWDGIEAAMAEQGQPTGKPVEPQRRAKVVPLWWRRVAAAAACLVVIIGVTGYLFNRNGGDATRQVSLLKGESGSESMDGRPSGNVMETAMRSEGGNLVAQAISRAATFVKEKDADRLSDAEQEKAELTEEKAVLTAEAITAGEKNAHKPTATGQEPDRYKNTTDKRNDNQYIAQQRGKLPTAVSNGRRQGISVGVYGMGLAGMGNSSAAQEPLFYSSSMQSDAVWNDDNIRVSSSLLATGIADLSPEELKVKHRQPVKAGLTAHFSLTDRLGLETGMYYTYLSSDFTNGSETHGSKTHQKLHYVGVPVRMTCSLWRNKGLNVYAGAGAAVEIGVGGSVRTDKTAGGEVQKGDEESLREKRPQFSVNASAGLQYDINDHVGVYMEPGVSYYIKNGSNVRNFYKDKPLNFSLSLGLRFTVK